MDSLSGYDFNAHNERVRKVWSDYRSGHPTRVPMILGVNPRYTFFQHEANPRRTSYEEYCSDPQTMLERQLEHLEWCAFHLFQDAEMGLPEVWTVGVDFQNTYEAAAWGAPVKYCDGQVPDTSPILTPSNRGKVLNKLPDPEQNAFLLKIWAFHEHFMRKEREGFEWRGRPIKVGAPCGLATDGPVTGACNLRGAVEFCLDLMDEPDFAEELLGLLTEAIIVRIRVFRKRLGIPERDKGFSFADDSIALLSTQTVRERVLPHHRRLVEELSTGGPNSIHLCGDATRHFALLKDELNIRSFDTGFPVDFGALRRAVGEEVEILGGPSVPFLSAASPAEVFEETRRILESGIKEGGRFILREGNNLAPEITPANVEAMYMAVNEFGSYGEA